MKLCSSFKSSPIDLAGLIISGINKEISGSWGYIGKVEAKHPGFINFFFSPEYLMHVLLDIKKNGDNYGRSKIGSASRLQVEFVSANPTGPLTIAHGRQAAIGDSLANILEFTGYRVTREYYLNDEGTAMTIRTRLTFWYAGILTVSLLVIGVGTYRELNEQLRRDHRREPEEHAVSETGEMVFQVGLPAILLGLLGGWWLTRKALVPMSKLTDAVEKIHERNLREPLPRTGNGDELDRLTEVFNGMLSRLDDSFNRTREFTLHASHELKTPLTVLCGETETALCGESLSAAERERAASLLDELRRLARIVDGLTLLAKADAGQVALKLEPVRLDELVRDNFADAQILAEPHGIQVELTTCEEVSVRGDRHRLRQLLLNLADNAVKYNQPQGRVTMSLRRANDAAEFTIANTSTGIPPEMLPRVFDRFFRGDPAHSPAVDGCGLGLSIVQWIVSAHGGTITVTSEPSKLTTVTVRLPLDTK